MTKKKDDEVKVAAEEVMAAVEKVKTARREKALKSFVATWGEEKGVKLWEAYCKKSGLLEKATG